VYIRVICVQKNLLKSELQEAKATLPAKGSNKKGEGRFSFTFLRREISPAKVEQHAAAIV
jgi:hypothetical protein